jgi:hypothetical protein
MTTRKPALGPWPVLPHQQWTDTIETLHLWTQVVGKIRMGNSPWINHSWSVPLYVSTAGLRTSLIPYGADGVELSFDFIDHELTVHASTGQRRVIALEDGTVADFYSRVMEAMSSIGMPVTINVVPSEVPAAIPFDQDMVRRRYDPPHAHALWKALLRTHRVLTEFRAGFLGKASPVHFFWGGFDLATTRFSGRSAPPHPGGIRNLPDDVTQEAYSQEVTSAGFWPGSRDAPNPTFYAYSYPTPEGYAQSKVEPDAAAWLDDLGEFALSYGALSQTDDPDATLLAFFESTHAAAADLAGWDRATLECRVPLGPDWWTTRPHAVKRPPLTPD